MSIKDENRGVEIFSRYCKNQFTRDDLKTIFNWFENNGYDIVRRISMKRWWKSLEYTRDKLKPPDYAPRQILDKIHHRINLEIYHKEKHKRNIPFGNKLIQAFSRAAAVLIVPLVALSVFLYMNKGMVWQNNNTSHSEVYAPQNSRLKIQLPDGTIAWLNNGSSLKYPQQFSNKSRQVKLNGEAFFHVKENQRIPFRVYTSDLNIMVTGTAFNISAYQDDKNIITTVEKGSVILEGVNEIKRNNYITELTANQQSTFHKASKVTSLKHVNPQKYTSWRKGKLILIDDPMLTVKKKLERWYNVEIEIIDPKVYDYKYTATFTHESVEQAMKYLSMAAPISYEIKLGEKQPDNSFSRKKVFIGKK
jgi:ferric-dicitrate binding protein FerR (iron transport regulator)